MTAKIKSHRVFFSRISKKGIGASLLLTLFSASAALLPVIQTEAAVNNNLNFQARLQTAAGAIVADGYYNVQFKLYDGGTAGGPAGAGAANAGTNLWTETYYDSNGSTAGNDNRVRVKNGYVSVNLGSQTAFPGTIDWSQELWLTMNIGGTAQVASPTWDGEMNPRLKLTGVPYAFKANSANQLQTVNGSYNSTLTLAGPTVGNQSFVIPDQGAAGTYNLLTTASANAGYIQNGTSLQTANFNISGNGQFGGYVSATGGFRANGQTGLSATTCSGGQLLQNAVVTGGIVTGGTCIAASSVAGVTTVGTFSATSIANGASISGNTITLGVADINNPGMVSTTAQTFLGAKTFNSGIVIGGTGINAGSYGITNAGAIGGASSVTAATSSALTLTANAASTWSTSAGALTLTSAAAATWGTGAGNLTLNAAGGTIVMGSNTTALQKAGSAFSFDLNNAAASTFTITNSNATVGNVANLDVEGGMNIGSGQTYKVGNTQISSANLSNDSNLAKINAMQNFTGTNTFTNQITTTGGITNNNAGIAAAGAIAGATTINASGAITGASLSVTGDLTTGNQVTRSMTRTIPTTINSEVDLGSFALTNGAGVLNIAVTIPSSGFSVSRKYEVPVYYNATNNVWYMVRPTSDTGPFSSNDVSLEVNVNNGTASFRLRRSLGTTTGTAYITIVQQGVAADAFTASTATASVTAPTAYYNVNQIYQSNSTGNVGVGLNAAPAYKLDVNGDMNISAGSVYRVNGAAGAAISCSGGQLLQNATVVGGIVTVGSCVSPTTGGVTTVGTFSATSIANGASISGNTITLGVADINNPGMVSTGDQTFAGNKTFNGNVNANTLTVNNTANQQIQFTAGATNHNVEIGRTDGFASFPLLDFHSGATAVDYDTRIISSGGTGVSGGGSLTLNAATVSASNNLVAGGTLNVTGDVGFGNDLTVDGVATVGRLEAVQGFHIGEGTWDSSKLLYSYQNWGTASDAYGVYGYRYATGVNGPSSMLVGTAGRSEGYELGNGNSWGWAVGVLGLAGGAGGGPTTSGVVNNAASLYGATSGSYSTNIGNRYGLYLENVTGGSTSNYAIYSAGGQSYLTGALGLGVASGAYKLNVAGDINVTSGSVYRVNGAAGATTTCGAGQVMQGQVVQGGIVTGGTCTTPAAGGVTAVGAISGTSNANGATITGTTINLTPADGTNGGVLTNGAQTIAGTKTFNGGVIVAGGQNLTMNSGVGTFSQTFTATAGSAATVTNANTTGTNSSIMSLDRNAAGGTTTNGLSIANTAGTLTNGIQFTGTMTNLINATNFTVTNAGALTAASTIRSNAGFNVNGTAGASIASCGAGSFLQNATVVGGIVTAGSCAAATNGVTTVGTFNAAGVANGASISGNTITFGAATASNPGMVSTGAQTLAGSKTFTGNNTLIKPGTNSTTAFQIQPAGSATPVFNVDTSNGLVGIGTDAPLYKLDIAAGSNNGLRVQTANDAMWGLMFNNLTYGSTYATGMGFWQGDDGVAHIDNNDIRSLTIATNGNVGIGANLNYKLDVDGQINATSGYRFNGTAGATTTCSGGNFLQNAVIQGGIVTGGTCVAGAAGGVTTVGAISGTSNANGATITGSTINLTAADGTNGGVVTNTTQTFGGNKTFNGSVTAASFTTAGALTGASLNITGATAYAGSMTIGDTSADRLTVNSQLLGGSPLVFQGATDNSFSTTLALVDPTANRTITLPNASGTVAVSASGPLGLNSSTGNLSLGTVGIANGGTGATSFTTNGLVYSNGSSLTSTAAGSTGQCLIGSTGAAPTWGTCGTASTLQDVYNSSGSTNPQIQLNGTNGGLKLRDASSTVGNLLQLQNSAGTVTYFAVTAGGLSLQNSSGTTAMDFNNSTGRLRIYNPSDASKYADIYYDNAAGEAVFAANNGNTRIGNGSGNIVLTTTNAGDVASYTHTGTLSGASSANDFTMTQNLVAGSNALTGSVLRVEQLSSGTNITSSVLYLNTTSSTATLLTASLSGAEKFKVTSAGSVSIAAGQTVSSVSGSLGIASGSGALNLTAGGANSVIVKAGTDNASAFAVQNSSNNAVLSVDTSGAATLFGKASSVLGKLTLYNASNANTVSIQSGVTSTSYTLTLPTAAPTVGQCLKGGASTATSLEWGGCGAASASKTVTIVPEYPGAVMSALSGSGNYNGTLTSDFDDTNNHNYYSWRSTQGTLQDYDVVVRTPIPNTYASGFGNLNIWMYTDSTSTTNTDVTVNVRKTSGGTTTSCGTANTSILATSASTWQQRSISVGSCTFASDDILMLSFRMKSRNNLGVAIGEITYTYNN